MKALFAVLLIFGVVTLARGEFIGSPVPPSSVVSQSVIDPFLTTTLEAVSVRYQQVYPAADFLRFGETRYQITAISFSAGHRFDPEETIPNLDIRLSTTTRSADQLSSVFSENIGADEKSVFFGSVNVATTGFEWNMRITLEHSFLFDPRLGNLLMDVRNYQTIPFNPAPLGSRWLITGIANSDDGSSIAFSYDVTSAEATNLRTVGLFTAFTATPIPRLTVSRTSSDLVFRWVNDPSTMLLEQNSSIRPGSTWTPAGGIVTTNGNGYKFVVLPVNTNTPAQFFRLVLPPSGPSAGSPDANLKVEISTPKR